MATVDLTNDTAGIIHVVDADVHFQAESKAAVDISAGQPIVFDANGMWVLADGDTQATRDLIYFAMRTVKAGGALTGAKQMLVDGLGITGSAFGDPIYLSNTAGSYSSGVPGTGNTVILGRVVPIFNAGATANKLARLCAY